MLCCSSLIAAILLTPQAVNSSREYKTLHNIDFNLCVFVPICHGYACTLCLHSGSHCTKRMVLFYIYLGCSTLHACPLLMPSWLIDCKVLLTCSTLCNIHYCALHWGLHMYMYIWGLTYMPSNLQLTLAASWSEVWDDAHVAEVTWQLLSVESGVLYCSSPDTACHAIVISYTCMHPLIDINLALARRPRPINSAELQRRWMQWLPWCVFLVWEPSSQAESVLVDTACKAVVRWADDGIYKLW